MSDIHNTLRQSVYDLDDITYEILDHAQSGKLTKLVDALKTSVCNVIGHEFEYDQCGFWQHQFCLLCRESKYPTLASKNCGELIKEMGSIEEAEYLKGEAS